MKIVKFKDNMYGIREWSWFDYEYLSFINGSWLRVRAYDFRRHCHTSLSKAQENYKFIDEGHDRGTPIEEVTHE